MTRFILSTLSVLFLGACAATAPMPESKEPLKLTQASFSALPGWKDENFTDLASAYERSCNIILKRDSQSPMMKDNKDFGLNQEWQIACRKFAGVNKTSASAIRAFFEASFTPYAAGAGQNHEGLFTGYYEASLNGSRTRHGPYQYPLRARPGDLVMVDLGEFRDELKGQRIAGRVKNGRLKPYETHADIVNGGLPKGQDKVIVWVDNEVDAFFIQIQGSGIVRLDDGSVMRVGYAAQNGHPYYAIGRELVKRGELNKDDISLQTIRGWLLQNPGQAQDLMTTNKSYVFFEEQKNKGGVAQEGPKGGSGLDLTAMRSLAIDHSLIPYHIPVWLDAQTPGESTDKKISRLMVTQDTGGAIRGPVRGDFFWGHGAKAEELAGKMKSKGRYWFLIPKNI